MSNVEEVNKVPTGEELRKMYMESVDPGKVLEVKTNARKMLNELALEIKDNILKKRAPIATKTSADLFKDFTFTLICEEVASELGLKIYFRDKAIGIDVKTRQPIIATVMYCTFK